MAVNVKRCVCIILPSCQWHIFSWNYTSKLYPLIPFFVNFLSNSVMWYKKYRYIFLPRSIISYFFGQLRVIREIVYYDEYFRRHTLMIIHLWLFYFFPYNLGKLSIHSFTEPQCTVIVGFFYSKVSVPCTCWIHPYILF